MKKCPSCSLVFEVEANHITALEHRSLSQQLDDVLVCTCPGCGNAMPPAHRGEQQTWERMREYLNDHR